MSFRVLGQILLSSFNIFVCFKFSIVKYKISFVCCETDAKPLLPVLSPFCFIVSFAASFFNFFFTVVTVVACGASRVLFNKLSVRTVAGTLLDSGSHVFLIKTTKMFFFTRRGKS